MRSSHWFFGNAFDQFNGKKITRIRVYIGRSSVNMQGLIGPKYFTLRMHNLTSKPGANGGTPSLSSNNYRATLDFGQSKWVDVTSQFKTLMTQSSWKGFAVKTDSASNSEYMAMNPKLKVEVTYNA